METSQSITVTGDYDPYGIADGTQRGMAIPSPSEFALSQRYRRQREKAKADRTRRSNARAHGYHGPFTRNDLAVMAR